MYNVPQPSQKYWRNEKNHFDRSLSSHQKVLFKNGWSWPLKSVPLPHFKFVGNTTSTNEKEKKNHKRLSNGMVAPSWAGMDNTNRSPIQRTWAVRWIFLCNILPNKYLKKKGMDTINVCYTLVISISQWGKTLFLFKNKNMAQNYLDVFVFFYFSSFLLFNMFLLFAIYYGR